MLTLLMCPVCLTVPLGAVSVRCVGREEGRGPEEAFGDPATRAAVLALALPLNINIFLSIILSSTDQNSSSLNWGDPSTRFIT